MWTGYTPIRPIHSRLPKPGSVKTVGITPDGTSALTPTMSYIHPASHITLKIKGGDYQETIRVVQYGSQFSKINEENFNFDYKGGIFPSPDKPIGWKK